MMPKRPYLLRAFYDWIVDNDMTPHIVVNALADEVSVPKQHVKDGKIVLNVSPMAVQDFILDNTAVSFSARFGGVSFYIYCPIYAIEAVYAREAPEEGVSFSPDEYAQAGMNNQTPGKRGNLKPVLAAVPDSTDDDEQGAEEATVEIVDASAGDSDDSAEKPATDKPKEGAAKRPSLRVIK